MNFSHFRFIHQGLGLTRERVQSLSDLHLYPFPKDYCDFLTQMNGCYLYSNFFDKDTTYLFNYRGVVGVNSILHFGYDAFYDTFGVGDSDDILETRNRMRIDLPLHYLPIAHCEGGNYVFMDLRNSKVYFEDHEKLDLGELGLVLLANSFSEFISRIKFEEPLN